VPTVWSPRSGFRVRLGVAASDRVQEVLRRLSGPSLLFAAAVWLCRRFLFSSALPAGTDMLDVLARTRQNAHWDVLVSPWSPSGLGLPRQTSLDNLLGLLALVSGDPVRTVKLLMVGLLLGSGLSAYWVVWRWYGDRSAATLGGLLYMSSQASLGRVASGWLHYEALIALAPLLLYLWVSLLDQFAFANALAFAVLTSGVIFARQDMILWLVPALALYAPIRFMCAERASRAFRGLAATLAVVVPAVFALSLYLVLPLRAGIHAPWLSTGQVFEAIRFNLVDRSLDAYQSILGLGRDLGYLPFNGEEWWNFHPWFSRPIYYAIQGTIVATAFAGLTVYRDRRTIYLAACAVMAAFLGKGIRGPLGGPYWWGVEHLPVFGNLRGPNRWLIVQAFSYAVLAAITVHWAHRRLLARTASRGRLIAPLIRVGLVLVCCVFFLPVAPTLISGFRTWEPTSASVELMHRVARDRSQFAVVSVPYDQSMRFLSQGDYRGWEHDLGVESSLYTGHPALSTNSWDRRGSDFVDFTASLLRSHDPAFAALLGSVGVKYALGFDYPAESARTGQAGVLFGQQRALAAIRGLVPAQSTSGGTLYRLPASSPILSFRTNIAVVLGGRDGLAALANLPGIRMEVWAAFTADDLISDSGSLARLVKTMRASDLVLVSGASLEDLSVLASPPVARIDGITSDPGLDRKAGLLLTDESARRGSLADQSVQPPALVASSVRRFQLHRSARLELWARVLASRDAGSVVFTVDGRRVRSLVPLDPGKGGFRWVHAGTLRFRTGEHIVQVAGSPSAFGRTFEVDEARLIEPGTRVRKLLLLRRELAKDAAKVAYSLDLSASPYAGGTAESLTSRQVSFWRPQDPRGISAHTAPAPGGIALHIALTGRRRFYTIAYHSFPRPQSWAARSYALLRYRGSGDGARYDVLVDSNERRTRFASFPLVDSSLGWQTLALPLREGTGNWRHVVSVRVATKTKDSRGSIELGPVRLLFPTQLVKTVELPTFPAGSLRVSGAMAGQTRLTMARVGEAAEVRVVIPTRLASRRFRLVMGPEHPIHPVPAVPVEFHTSGAAHYGYSFTAPRRGVLVFNQTYDPRWTAADGNRPASSTGPVMSLVDGFFFARGRHTGSVWFRGRQLVQLGAAMSAGILAALFACLIAVRRARGPRPAVFDWQAQVATRPVTIVELKGNLLLAGAALGLAPFSFGLSAAVVVAASLTRAAGWRRPVIVAALLVLAAPVWVALGRPEVADRVAVVAIFSMAVALLRLVFETRKTVRA
jgi:hypothetical protein